jgi:hypothetical protein
VLAEQLVTCRVVLFVKRGRTPALQTRIDKQQEQTYGTHADAGPRDEAAIKPADTKCAVPGITRCGSTGKQRNDQPDNARY